MMDRVVVEINELAPDIVLCTGDLTEMGFRPDYVTAKEYLDRIEAPLRRRARQPRRAQRRATCTSRSSSGRAGTRS